MKIIISIIIIIIIIFAVVDRRPLHNGALSAIGANSKWILWICFTVGIWEFTVGIYFYVLLIDWLFD